jgi:hypothetical protein
VIWLPTASAGHCRRLLERNCGLAVSGTNSDANSLSVDERIQLLEAGLDTMRIGTGLPIDSDDGRDLERAYAKSRKLEKKGWRPQKESTAFSKKTLFSGAVAA